MAPSRIVFALGDLLTEIARLIPKDGKATAILALDAATFRRVEGELKQYGAGSAAASVEPPAVLNGAFFGLDTISFRGLRIVSLPDG